MSLKERPTCTVLTLTLSEPMTFAAAAAPAAGRDVDAPPSAVVAPPTDPGAESGAGCCGERCAHFDNRLEDHDGDRGTEGAGDSMSAARRSWDGSDEHIMILARAAEENLDSIPMEEAPAAAAAGRSLPRRSPPVAAGH